MIEQIRERFTQVEDVIRSTCEHLSERIERAVEIVVESYRGGGAVLVFGNGGSAADAQHIACELVGRFLLQRPPLRAQALTTDSSILTAVSNDYDFTEVFARQIEANANPGDVAIALTTSGNSPNVVAALTKARQIGMKTIALTGSGGGKCAQLADVLLDVPGDLPSPRIQEAHTVIYHILCELVERELTQE